MPEMNTEQTEALNSVKATVAAELKRISDEVKETGRAALNEAEKAAGKLGEETKARIDQALAKQGELQGRLLEVEQKLAARQEAGPQRAKTIGETIVESDEFKGFKASGAARVRIGVKAIITSATTLADGSAGDLVRNDRQAGIVNIPDRRLTVRDLITPGRTTSNAIEYVKETGFTNAAAIQAAEGDAKAASDLQFDLVTSAVRTIAHYVRASKQILDDAPMLQSYIDGRLRYGLAYVEEAQLLMGSGSGANLNGIYTQATAYSAPTVTSAPSLDTSIDLLRLAILQAELALYPVTGMVLNPIDWAVIETTKETTGGYVFANPQGVADPRLWGRPVVSTPAMTVDKFLVGAFKLGAQLFDREDANVLISTEDQDNFIKNLVTIRAEERIGLAVYRPAAFIKGDFGRV
jgi:HK97 family phage major capsid protein